MKIRTGFVTNSSSSSFIIATKAPMTDDELARKIRSVFCLPEQHVLYRIANEIADMYITHGVRTVDVLYNTEDTRDEWDGDDYLLDLLERYGSIRHGYFSENEGASAEQMLSVLGPAYEDDEIIITRPDR